MKVSGLREFTSLENPQHSHANLTLVHEHLCLMWMACRDELQYYHLLEMQIIAWHNGGNDNDGVKQRYAAL